MINIGSRIVGESIRIWPKMSSVQSFQAEDWSKDDLKRLRSAGKNGGCHLTGPDSNYNRLIDREWIKYINTSIKRGNFMLMTYCNWPKNGHEPNMNCYKSIWMQQLLCGRLPSLSLPSGEGNRYKPQRLQTRRPWCHQRSGKRDNKLTSECCKCLLYQD